MSEEKGDVDTSITQNSEQSNSAHGSSSKKKRKRSTPKKRDSNTCQKTASAATSEAAAVQAQNENSVRKPKKRKRHKKQNCGDGPSIPNNGSSQQLANTTSTKPQSTGASNYPYPTDYNDHFETPLRAYTDILPLMQSVIEAKSRSPNISKSNPSKFTIYDPYFCTGRAATLLEQTFTKHNAKSQTKVCIQHEKRDFYKDIRKNKVPQHDILVTNPPYSGNHKERCLEFAVGQLKSHGRPFFLLMPNYVASKEYFRKVVLEENVQNVFVAPSSSQPYEYDHPEGTGKETPPFQSVWFCGLIDGSDNNATMSTIKDGFMKYHSKYCKGDKSIMPRIASSLQELIRIGGVSGEKRKNPRQRKKMRQLAMQKAQGK
jgi:hypothetical protein